MGKPLHVLIDERVMPEPMGGCWLWMGTLDSSGYARLNVGSGSPDEGHRLSYECFIGPIPSGLTLDHLCSEKSCVNPAHLEPVTSSENTRRWNMTRTHCKYGHEFTPENTLRMRHPVRGWSRTCRACNRRRAIESSGRRRAQ